jgi:hypothetical protein
MKLTELPRKRSGKLLLKLGFKACGKPFNFTKQVGKKRIHVLWKDLGWNSGYFAHVEKYPH